MNYYMGPRVSEVSRSLLTIMGTGECSSPQSNPGNKTIPGSRVKDGGCALRLSLFNAHKLTFFASGLQGSDGWAGVRGPNGTRSRMGLHLSLRSGVHEHQLACPAALARHTAVEDQ